MARVTVFVVDDDLPFRRLAAELLTGLGYVVVAQAADGRQALSECARARPDAALVDVNLPDMDGFALARALSRGASPPRVLLTSTDGHAATPGALTEAGAVGFVPKAELAVTDLTRFLGHR
jgi:two-component system, chemotaxis family, chemotaxis protein CheY